MKLLSYQKKILEQKFNYKAKNFQKNIKFKMVDWKGLYNWSMKYTDGTKPSDFKQMSKEDMEFIQNAFESVSLNEMKEIWKILDICKTPEGDTEQEINERYELLEKMSEYIDGLENANNIVRGKRFNEIINHFFESKHKKIKIEYARIITQMSQNDSFVQKAALDLGIFNYLKDLNEEKDPELMSIYIYLLTGLLYGEEISTRKFFVEQCDGIKLLFNTLVKEIKSNKNTKRLLNIFSELTKETDEKIVKGGNDLRKYIFNEIKEIKLHNKFINMLNDYQYKNDNECDIIHIVFSIISNLTELYMDNISEVFDEIKKMNKLIDSSSLSEEMKKNEKSYLINVIKEIKEKMKTINEKPKEENKENDNYVETKKIGNKDSMRIKLKK